MNTIVDKFLKFCFSLGRGWDTDWTDRTDWEGIRKGFFFGDRNI